MTTYPGRTFNGPVDSSGLPTTYYDNWQSLTNLTPAQQQWFRSQPQWLTTYVGIRRWQKEIGGISFGGIAINTDEASRSLLDGLAVRAMRDQQSNPSASYTLTSKGTSQQISIAQALSLFDAVSGFIQACRATEGQIIAGINAATVTNQDQIDAAIGAVLTSF